MTTIKVVYAYSGSYAAFGKLRTELRKVGIEVDDQGEIPMDVPRHDPRLVAIVEKFSTGKEGLHVKEIVGSGYMIRQLEWCEEVVERDAGGWIEIP